jgi:hypothetical protein
LLVFATGRLVRSTASLDEAGIVCLQSGLFLIDSSCGVKFLDVCFQELVVIQNGSLGGKQHLNDDGDRSFYR